MLSCTFKQERISLHPLLLYTNPVIVFLPINILQLTQRMSLVPGPIPCTRAIDLGVILDATNSVGMKNFVTAKQFVLALVNSMNIAPGASHLGLIVYNIQATIIMTFNETAKQDPAVIEGILKATTKLRGRTFTDRALRKAGEKLFTPEAGDRPVKPDVLVVLTDGKTNAKSEPYETAVEPLKVCLLYDMDRVISEKKKTSLATSAFSVFAIFKTSYSTSTLTIPFRTTSLSDVHSFHYISQLVRGTYSTVVRSAHFN